VQTSVPVVEHRAATRYFGIQPEKKVTIHHADALPQGGGSGLLPRRQARGATVAVWQRRSSWQGNGQR